MNACIMNINAIINRCLAKFRMTARDEIIYDDGYD